MKKISIFLCLFLVTLMLSLTACGKVETPKVTEGYPYTVSFNTAGGTKVDPKNVNVVMYSPTSIKENYVLEGWYFDKNKTIPVEFPLSVDSNFTIYAKWKETLYSLQSRFSDYMNTVGNKIEKNYTEGSFSFEYTVETIGKHITYSWKRTYTDSSDSTYNDTYSYAIRFEFGDFSTAEGTVTFRHQDQAGLCISSSYFYSARIEGNTYLLNLNDISLYNSSLVDYTTSTIERNMQATLLGALNDIRGINHLDFYNAILDYNGNY